MKGLELHKHSITNKQTYSRHILHMKTIGFGKGMCEKTKKKGYAK
jgi:hypothetical protein